MKYVLSVFLALIALFSHAQQTDYVDFKKVEAVMLFNPIEVDTTLYNSYKITFNALKQTDSIYLDAVNMRFKNVSVDKKQVRFKNDGKKLIIYKKFKASKTYALDFVFFVAPKKAMYFVGTSHWLPSIDDMNDKIEFDLTIAAPKDYEVIANGKLVQKNKSLNYNLWEYDMEKPMSSYLVALVVGKYKKKIEYSKSGVPLEMYYYPEDSIKFEPTYRYTKRMFDFLEEEIGVPYPWQNYKQVPVHDFLYAGMENTSLTIFADTFVIDSIAFSDKNYVNVNAHELAHQWFGDLVTETSGKHHWLHEGFATYYALLAEKEVFGDDYYYWKLFQSAQQLLQQEKMGGNTSLLDPKSTSLTFYEKGAWVLHMLRDKVGDLAFRKAVINYLQKHQFQNVETKDFLDEMEQASGMSLKKFSDKWLVSDMLPYEEMELHLYQTSTMMKGYLQVDCNNKDRCQEVFTSAANKYIRMKAVEQLAAKLSLEAFNTNDLEVRQAIAQNLTKIPLELKEAYESLLSDKSYQTIETALYNLWVNFPEYRAKYLNQTKNIIGFSDKNVRLLWLTLNLATPEYKPGNKKVIYNELLKYTSEAYGFEVRQRAFTYLNSLQACNDDCVENLKLAANHHNWRLKKFAKSLLNEN